MTTSRGSGREYQPTPEQLERAKALNRFHRWTVTVPVVIASLIVLTLFGLLIWLAVVREDARALASATADLLTIFAIIPMLFLSIAIPGVAIYVVIESRRRAITPIRSLQRLLWRLESLIITVRTFVRTYSPRVAKPVVTFNSWFVRGETLLNNLISQNSARSMLHERNQSTELEE